MSGGGGVGSPGWGASWLSNLPMSASQAFAAGVGGAGGGPGASGGVSSSAGQATTAPSAPGSTSISGSLANIGAGGAFTPGGGGGFNVGGISAGPSLGNWQDALRNLQSGYGLYRNIQSVAGRPHNSRLAAVLQGIQT